MVEHTETRNTLRMQRKRVYDRIKVGGEILPLVFVFLSILGRLETRITGFVEKRAVLDTSSFPLRNGISPSQGESIQ